MPRMRQLRSRPKRPAVIRRYRDVIGGVRKGVHDRTPFYCFYADIRSQDEKIYDNILGSGSDTLEF